MKRVTTLLIAALVVIALFATIAAARGDFCTECNGEVRLLRTAGPFSRTYSEPCHYGAIGEFDTVTERYRVYYYGCNNCSYAFDYESIENTHVRCPHGIYN